MVQLFAIEAAGVDVYQLIRLFVDQFAGLFAVDEPARAVDRSGRILASDFVFEERVSLKLQLVIHLFQLGNICVVDLQREALDIVGQKASVVDDETCVLRVEIGREKDQWHLSECHNSLGEEALLQLWALVRLRRAVAGWDAGP